MLNKFNLQINKFGINLRRVCIDDLEKLRTWRNSEYVNKRMVSNEYITMEMQEMWFKSVSSNLNYYFIASFNGEELAVISIKNISNNAGEGAIYLVSDKFENTGVVARIVMCFNDFVFDKLELDFICSHVKRDNSKAISSTIAQGGIEVEEKSTHEFIHFIVKKDSYFLKTKKLRDILIKIK